MLWLAAAWVLGVVQPIAPISGGNALTLPAQRHVVRVAPQGRGIYLLALQQGGQEGRGLGFWRSDDDGRTFFFYAPIQNDYRHLDRADLLAVGDDIALVYSYEGPSLVGSEADDVYFQWWRYRSDTNGWEPQPAVLVFDSTQSATAYSRGELAIDSRGRLWVQAFRLEEDGRSRAVLAVSEDHGATFEEQRSLDLLPRRGGGRLLALGGKLLFLYDMHDGLGPAYYRTRDDSAPLGEWREVRDAFPEGIYHGAALTAVADGRGGAHIVYKDELDRLSYRAFDGQSLTFGPRTILEPSGNWAIQAAITRLGDEAIVFSNRLVSATHYEIRARRLRDGVFSSPVVLDAEARWKGYLASPEVLPASTATVPCFYGSTPDAATSGLAVGVRAAWASGTEAPPPDAGTTAPGSSDAGSPGDAGTPGSQTPDGGSNPTELFRDDFERAGTSLGPEWLTATRWYTNGRAITNRDANNVAVVALKPCASCRVEALVRGFAVANTALFLRARSSSGADRYEVDLGPDGWLELRRYRGGQATVLARGPSGVTPVSAASTLALTVTGKGPVQLTAHVNGAPKLTATDSSAFSLLGPGYAGMFTTRAGVVFDKLRLTSQ